MASYTATASDRVLISDAASGATIGYFANGWSFMGSDRFLNNISSGSVRPNILATYNFNRTVYEDSRPGVSDAASGKPSRNGAANETRAPIVETITNTLTMRGSVAETAQARPDGPAVSSGAKTGTASDTRQRIVDSATSKRATNMFSASETRQPIVDVATAVFSIKLSTPVERALFLAESTSTRYTPRTPFVPPIPTNPNAIPDAVVTVYDGLMSTIFSLDCSQSDFAGGSIQYEDTPSGNGAATLTLGLYSDECFARGYWAAENIVEISTGDSILAVNSSAGATKLYVDSAAPFDTALGEDTQQAYVRTPNALYARIPVISTGHDSGGAFIAIGSPTNAAGTAYILPALTAGVTIGRRRYVGRIKSRQRTNDRTRRCSISLLGLSSTLAEANGTFTLTSLDVGQSLYSCISQFASRWPFLTIASQNFPAIGQNYSGSKTQSSLASMCSDILAAITTGDVWNLRIGHDRIVRLVHTYDSASHAPVYSLTMPQGVYEFEPLSATTNDEDSSNLYNAVLVTGDTDPQTKQPCSAIAVDSSSIAFYGRQIDASPVTNQACKTNADCLRYAQTLLNQSSLALANNSFRVYTRNDYSQMANTPGGIRQGDVVRALSSVTITRFNSTGISPNFVPDSEFSCLNTVWTVNSASVTLGVGYGGSTGITASADGTDHNLTTNKDWVDVVAGDWWTISVYADARNVQSGSPGIILRDYDTGADIGQALQAAGTASVVYASFQIPVGTTRARVSVTTNSATTSLTPNTVSLSRPMLTRSNRYIPYEINYASPPSYGLVASVVSTINVGSGGQQGALDRYQEVRFAAIEPDWSASISERTNAIASALTANRQTATHVDSYCVSAEAFPSNGIPFTGLTVHPPSFAALFAAGTNLQIVGDNYFTVKPNATNWAWLNPDGSWTVTQDTQKIPGAILYALFQANATTIIGERNLASVGISNVGAAAVASSDFDAPVFASDPTITAATTPSPTDSNIEIVGTLSNVPRAALSVVVLYRQHVDTFAGQTPGPWIPIEEYPLVGGASQPAQQAIDFTVALASGGMYDLALQYRGPASYGQISAPIGNASTRQNGFRALQLLITAPYLASNGSGYVPTVTLDAAPASLESPDNINAAVQVSFTVTNQQTDGSLRKIRFWYHQPSTSDVWVDGGAQSAVGLGQAYPPSSGDYTFTVILPLGSAYDFAMSAESTRGDESQKVFVGHIDASSVVLTPDQISQSFQSILNSSFQGLEYADDGSLVIPPHVEICPSQRTFSMDLSGAGTTPNAAYQTQQAITFKMRYRSDHQDSTNASDLGLVMFADGDPSTTDYQNGWMVQFEPSSISLYRKSAGTYYIVQGFGVPSGWSGSPFAPLDGYFHTVTVIAAPNVTTTRSLQSFAQSSASTSFVPGSIRWAIYYDNVLVGFSYTATGKTTISGYCGPRNQAAFPAFIDRSDFAISNGSGTVTYDELDPIVRGLITDPSNVSSGTARTASSLASNTVGSSQILTPTGVNILYNPNGSKSLQGWSTFGTAVQWAASYQYGGSFSAILNGSTQVDNVLQQQIGQVGTSNSSFIPGKSYTASGVIVVRSLSTGGQVGLDVLDSDGNILGTGYINQVGSYQAIFNLTARASSVAYFRMRVTAAQCEVYFYNLQLEQGDIATVFNDAKTAGVSALTMLPSGGIDLNNGLNQNYNLDAIPTGPQYGKISSSAINNGKALIDFADPLHGNKLFASIGGSAVYSQLDPNSVGVALNSVGNVTGPGATVFSTGTTNGLTWTTHDIEANIAAGKPYVPTGVPYQGGKDGLGGYPGLGLTVGTYQLTIPASQNVKNYAVWVVEFDWRVYGVNMQATVSISGALQNLVQTTGHANAFYNVYGSYVPSDSNIGCYNENVSSSFSGSISLSNGQPATIYVTLYAQCSNSIVVYANGTTVTRCTQSQSRLEVGNYVFRASRIA